MNYGHGKGIAHESASTYFQCGPFYGVAVHTSSPTTNMGPVWKDRPKIPQGWSPFISINSVETAAPFKAVRP